MYARNHISVMKPLFLSVACCLAGLVASAKAADLKIPIHHKGAMAPHASDQVLISVLPSKMAMKTKSTGGGLPGVRQIKTLKQGHMMAASLAANRPQWYVAKLTEGVSVDQALASLGAHEDVLHVEPDYLINAPPMPAQEITTMAADQRISEQYALNKLSLPQAWARHAGTKDTIVAVIDTGVQLDHPDLIQQIWANTAEEPNGIDDDGNGFVDDLFGWNTADETNNTFDQQGHGTHVAGIIAATRDNGLGIAGAANVSIMPINVFGSSESARTSDIMEAIAYAVNNGAKVINMSLGGGPFLQAFSDICDQAAAADVLIFAASGNESATQVGFPAAYASVVAVGATDSQDRLASFSNTGRDIELVAPGVAILSCFPGSSFRQLDGTSMATPYAAGVGALVRSAFPNMTAAQVRARLNGTADDLGPAGYDLQTGFGRLNAFRALTVARDATLPVTGGGGGNAGATDDSLEENDTPDEAVVLSAGTHDLMCLDEDWFGVRMTSRGTIRLAMQGNTGDLDMVLFSLATQTVVAESAQNGTDEAIEAEVEAGDYVWVVFPFEEQVAPYRLTFSVELQAVQPPITQPPVTQPPVTQPPVTQRPVIDPITNPPLISIGCGQASLMPMMGLVFGLLGMGGSMQRRSRNRAQ